LYGIGYIAGDRGSGINIIQEGPIFTTSAKWRVWKKLYIGMGYLGGNIETRLGFNSSVIPPDFDPKLDFDIGAITVPIEYDSRDHEQFPRSGWLLKAKTKIFRESVGSDFEAETSELAINHYRPARDNDAIAFRGYFRTTSGDAPFFLLSTFGGKTDLRGYESGRYRDKMMYALQSEYRWQFNDSWIFTGFAGFGEVAEDISAFGDNYLPAAGVGLRYVLSKKHRVGLSADIAYGKDGAEFYFGVGESF
jgi:outer membrane protein assembly factor BamA